MPRQFVERAPLLAGDDLAAELAQGGRQCVGDVLRAAARDWPADGMGTEEEREPEAAAERRSERQERVRAHPGGEATCLGRAEGPRAERRRQERGDAEDGEAERVPGD